MDGALDSGVPSLIGTNGGVLLSPDPCLLEAMGRPGLHIEIPGLPSI